MSTAITKSKGKYQDQTLAFSDLRPIEPFKPGLVMNVFRYGTQRSAAEINTSVEGLVLKEIVEEAKRVDEITAGLEAAGLILIGQQRRFMPSLRRRVLTAVLERSDGDQAMIRIVRDGREESRLIDAVQLSSNGITDPGQRFRIRVFEVMKPDGSRGTEISFSSLSDHANRRSEPTSTNSDYGRFAAVV